MARTGAGEYRERVVILTRTLAPGDDVGEEVETWPDPAAGEGEHWAKIDGTSGGEAAGAPRQSYRTITLRFRCAVDLAAVDRVRLKGTGDEFAVTGVWRERKADGSGFQTVCSLVG